MIQVFYPEAKVFGQDEDLREFFSINYFAICFLEAPATISTALEALDMHSFALVCFLSHPDQLCPPCLIFSACHAQFTIFVSLNQHI